MSQQTLLRKVRTDNGLTLRQVADGTKIDFSGYAKMEKGQQRVGAQTAEKIIRFFSKRVPEAGLNELHVIYPERYMVPLDQQQKAS